MLDRIVNGISGIAEGISNLAGDIASSISAAFQVVADYIIEGIKDIFVPDQEYIKLKFDTTLGEFQFIRIFHNLVEHIKDYLVENSFNDPPVIHIDLSSAESKYNWGTDAIALDMSWYAKYKPTVDAFLSAWIYLIFIYQVFTRLPNIINGVAGDFKQTYVSVDTYNQSQKPKRGRKGGK